MSTNREERKRIVPADEKVLSPTEVQGLETQLRDHEEDRKETDGSYSPDRPNSDDADPTIRRYKRVLQRGKPGSVSKQERYKRERQMEVDKEYLQKMMVPRSHVTLRASADPEFRKAVNFMAKQEMSSEYQTVAQRYKSNARLLYPDSPELSNLETIRPDKN